jgi:hypothetical protein
MLDKVEQIAMIKFAGDETAVAHFMDGFVKEAASNQPGFFEKMFNAPTGQVTPGANPNARDRQPDTLGHTLIRGIGQSLGQGIGTLAVTAGVSSVGSLYRSVNNSMLHSKFLQALERAYQGNRILRESDREKVQQYAETVFKFAPNVATDSNLLSSILANAIHGEGIDPMTIKTLTDLEGKFTDNTTFSPKQYSR